MTVTNKTLQKGEALSQIVGPQLPATTLSDPNVRQVQASVLDRIVASQSLTTNLTPKIADVSADRLQNLINDAHTFSPSSMPLNGVAGGATSRAPIEAFTSQSLGSVPSATSLSSMTRSISSATSLPSATSSTLGGVNNLTKGALRSIPRGH